MTANDDEKRAKYLKNDPELGTKETRTKPEPNLNHPGAPFSIE